MGFKMGSKLFPLALVGVTALLAVMLGCATSGAEKGETAQGAEKTQQEYCFTIRWSTASEVDNFGFNVYRGESEDGPFVKVNKEVILGAGTTDEPQYYEYKDCEIDPYKVYYYYVESIAYDQTRERFTPVYKAGPKIKEKKDRNNDK